MTDSRRAPELPEVIYTPESRIKHPVEMLRDMWRDILAARELGWRLTVRDISAQYRQTFLGYFWAFVPALVTGATLSIASRNRVVDFGEADIPYTAYVIIGMVLWQTFMESMTLQIQAMSKAREMLAKINFPREALILSGLGQTLFNFGIKILLLAATFVWFDLSVPATILLAPFALVLLLVLGTGLGVLLAPLGGLYEDVGRGIIFSAMALLIVTPVVFVPPDGGTFAEIVALNPITPLLVTTRDLMTTGTMTHPLGFFLASLFAVLLLLAAWTAYRLAMPIIIERMSA